MAKVTKKECSSCSIIKPVSEFNKQKDTKSGLKSQCKTCCRATAARRYGATAKGIDSWEQIPSIVEETYQLQVAIDNENDARRHRIGLINKYSDEAIEPWERHKKNLHLMLSNFLAKGKAQDTTEIRSRHGKAVWSRGHLKIIIYHHSKN